jgi:hypothetical protein
MLKATVVAGAALALAIPGAFALWLTSDGGSADGVRAVSRVAFEQETGVRIVRLAVVGGGGIVDVRFRILDPDKAISVQDKEGALTLVDEGSGKVLNTGFHGTHSGSTGLDPAATYYMLFANNEGALESGDSASVRVGDVRLEHVPVQ